MTSSSRPSCQPPGPGVNRNGVWVAATSSMRFIVVPPRADAIAR